MQETAEIIDNGGRGRPSATAAFDQRDFRKALGCFATGVTIITAQAADGERVGLTANSFSSLSLDPALVLWSIDRRAFSLPVFERASHFAVNVLSESQIELANRFATKGEMDKFAGMTVRSGAGDAPVLAGCTATFECAAHAILDGGDHCIIVGRVERFETSGKRALVYHQGAYSVSERHPFLGSAEGRVPKASGFAESHLDYLLNQAAHAFGVALDGPAREGKVPISLGRLLTVLGDNRTGMVVADLARITLSTDEETELALDDLVSRGWVAVSKADSKQQTYKLSEKGSSKLARLQQAALGIEADALGAFSATDSSRLKTMLREITQWARARTAAETSTAQ